MADLNEFQTDHLFLLVGGNPLPNYVAAKLLTYPDSHIYFVHSKETRDIAENLIRSLRWPSANIHQIQVDDAEAQDIFGKIRQHAEGKSDLGLHYTGGTKAMAVHAYRAIESANQEAKFSYLNARNLKMLIDQPGAASKSYPVGLEIKLKIEELLELHNYTLKKPPTLEPFQSEFCQAIFNISQQEWREWCNQGLRREDDKSKFKNKTMLKEVELPTSQSFASLQLYWSGCNTLADLAAKWDMKVDELAKFFDGLWLEHYALWAIQQVQTACHIHQSALNIEPKQTEFEFDVVAMRGYQLFALSCTTAQAKKNLSKINYLKLYNVPDRWAVMKLGWR